MSHRLKFGTDSTVCLDGCPAELVAVRGTPGVEPIDDPTRATLEALGHPLDYPPLVEMTTPGDRVAIALAEGVPGDAAIVAGVVRTLLDGGIAAEAIVLLQTAADACLEGNDPRRELPPEVAQQITLTVHDPGHQDGLAYLAGTEQGRAVFLNRALTEADLVVPIGCFRHAKASGCFGIHSPIFPAFSDRPTCQRFHSPDTLDARGRRGRQLVKEADEVGWLLGVNFSIQVIPGPGDGVLHIVAGRAEAVRRRVMKLDAAAWHTQSPGRARLVVAGIQGGTRQQTWRQVGLAAASGMELVEPGGALVVCCELADPPGMAMRQLCPADSRPEAIEQLRRHAHDSPDALPDDAIPAAQLAAALEHCHVYLLSRLDDATVEELDITPLRGVDEIVRLAGRCSSYLLLDNASQATVTVEEDNE